YAAPHRWTAGPVSPAQGTATRRVIVNPADPAEEVGTVDEASAGLAADAVTIAVEAHAAWAATDVHDRAAMLRHAADLYESNAAEFFALATREAGKTLADGVSELREAVDFLRYYAAEAPRAEGGTLARGAIVCISPWNFPLAIFTGQIAAALATGNTVLAKPAEQTPLIAARAVALLHEAGIPREVLQLLPGDGPSVGGPLTADPRIAGVCFTGSTQVAKLIDRQLAATAAPDAMLLAETGGLNAMIVDSTALPEQAVRDTLASAFQSAGQRCSALRILYVQEDVEHKVLEMLKGALEALEVGDPWAIATDVGPLIDDDAHAAIGAYAAEMEAQGKLVAKGGTPAKGRFVAPHVFRVRGIEALKGEVFGPILHVATFAADDIDRVIAAVNRSGYGLTFGLHTRIDARVQHVIDRVHAGNLYVNRNQIGAVVGSQPFGGEGLSGTGPKAGGPHYLRRFRRSAGSVAELAPARKATATQLVDSMPDPSAGGWTTRPDRIAVLRKHLRGKAAEAVAASAALDYGPVDLPGPTGEANTLTLWPRGRVLCLGPDGDALLAQAVQALAAGNAVLAVAPGAPATLQALTGKDLPIAAIDGRADPVESRALAIDAVAFAGTPGEMRVVREVMAAADGRIVPLIAEMINPAAYALERSVCVDTTAAGGNASLLASV
ncbi:MAG: L-glutamate gamma-semialdehyde dehydrogenase, partial [Rhizobiaceae bacterium]|nr:L-glutamate gamma-semialdehyde dehydrogenase [Rhizobiaceae bacterium]